MLLIAYFVLVAWSLGGYDLNAIKQFFITYFLSTSKTEEQEEEEEEQKEQEDKEKEEENDGIESFFVIKRNNTSMCLYDGSGSATTSI